MKKDRDNLNGLAVSLNVLSKESWMVVAIQQFCCLLLF